MDDDDEFGSDLDEELLLAASESYENSVTNNKSNNNTKSTPKHQSTVRNNASARKTSSARKANNNNTTKNDNYDDLLDGIFTSDLEDEDSFVQQNAPQQPPSLNRQGSSNMRQRTLFGDVADSQDGTPEGTNRSWRLVNHEEPPTHHKLDREAAKTWVYPANLTKRDYQFNIAKRALLSNVLVALPTGLGKTLIAATVMLNWYRWAPESYVIFLAPTKPLVNQQVDACYNIVGIPRGDTCQLTGGVSPAMRAEYWQRKRVFFMTPQTLHTDLTSGRCDAKKVVLMVIDEAHRATGAYAYTQVLQFIRRFNTSFRVMALTATPGSKIETVQEVITSLGIARTEIRTEESIDIKQYIRERNVEVQALPPGDEITMLSELLSEALKPILRKLNEMRVLFQTDPATLSAFTVHSARQQWMNSNAGRTASWAIKTPVMLRLGILSSVAHGFELLLYHGIKPFYDYLLEYQAEEQNKPSGGGKVVNSMFGDDNWKKMFKEAKKLIDAPNFVGHPKLECLSSVILQHFSNSADRGEEDTKVMVFANYRKSGEEITRILSQHKPIIKPTIFVGQSSGKNGEGGMSQKEQGKVLDRFKGGEFNVLVATSIGEEGLDIGEVDFIVCYDASASPIRMLQRMGRTGRKRVGGVMVLVTEGKEANKWEKAKDNYQFMQKRIAAGKDFTYAEDLSPRIIPSDIVPEVDMQHIVPPVENTLPDSPKKQARGRKKKAPPRIFQMPDGVDTGFTTASVLGGFKAASSSAKASPSSAKPPKAKKASVSKAVSSSTNLSQSLIAPQPILSDGDGGEEEDDDLTEEVTEDVYPEKDDDDSFLLTPSQEQELTKRYRNVEDGDEEYQIIRKPEINKYPHHMLSQRPTKFIKHGRATKSHIRLMRTIVAMDDARIEKYRKNLHPDDIKPPPPPRAKAKGKTPAKNSNSQKVIDLPGDYNNSYDTGRAKQSTALGNITNFDFTSAREKLAKFAANPQKKFKPPMLNRKPAVEEPEVIPISSAESVLCHDDIPRSVSTGGKAKERPSYMSSIPSSPSSMDESLPSGSQILKSSGSDVDPPKNPPYQPPRAMKPDSKYKENEKPKKPTKRKSDLAENGNKRVRR